MNIKTNSIVGKDGNSIVLFLGKPEIPSGSRLNAQGNINITSSDGISTVGFLTANNANVSEIVTATSFYGDGSGLTLPTASISKCIAFKYIFSDPPLRS